VPYTACGTDISQRIGRAVVLKSLHVKGLLVGGQNNLVTDDSYNVMRIAVFVGRSGLVTADWAARDINDPLLPGVDGVVEVLVDRFIRLQVPAADSVGYIPATANVDIVRALNCECLYGDSAISYPEGGLSLYFAMCSDSAAASHPGFTSGYSLLFWADRS
jgi:hypothetical protein